MKRPYKTRLINNGVQHLYFFPNNYGASVVMHEFSYGSKQGLWELAVLQLNPDEEETFSICYDTPITEDVLGHLTQDDVEDVLQQIKALPEYTGEPHFDDII